MTTPRTFDQAAAYLAAGRNKLDRPAPERSSTRIVRDLVTPGTISAVYHSTPVVTWLADSRDVILYPGGWATKTTAAVMEAYTFGDWRVQPRRRAAYVGNKVAERAIKRGESYIGADRSGRGDSMLYTLAGGAHLYADAGQAVRVGADKLEVQHVWMTWNMRYPCRCVMCVNGYSSWQEAAAHGAWSRA